MEYNLTINPPKSYIDLKKKKRLVNQNGPNPTYMYCVLESWISQYLS